MATDTSSEFVSHSDLQTEVYAENLARRTPPGTVIALHGDLGSGKTVFARGFARGLGITEPVSSPTYTIVQEYRLATGGFFYHMDLYRIQDAAGALGFGVDEFLNDRDSYSLIEWPERISDILPPGTRHLEILRISENERLFRFV